MTNFASIAAAIAAAITADGGKVELHFDVEATSLRGEGFAFGGFVRQGDSVIAEFALLSEEGEAKVGDYVRENIVPHLGDLPRCETQKELLRSFWTVYAATRQAVIDAQGCQPWDTGVLANAFAVVFDNGWPVEASFVLAAHDLAIADGIAGEFDGPYCPIDVVSILAAKGYNPDLPRSEAAEALGVTGAKHNPIVDARQSAAVYDAARKGTLDAKYRV